MTRPSKAIIDEHPTEVDERALRKGVSAFGDLHTVPRNWRPVGLVLRSDDGRVIGGLLGSTVWDWLQIDVLWVAEADRGRGHGRALIARAEEIARERSCQNARFEARGFYEKLGYRVYGELPGFPHGHSHLHLAKRFGDVAAG